MSEPVKLGEVIQSLNPLSGDSRCKQCGYGLRHTDETGLRVWCLRCINIYYRCQKIEPVRIENQILKMVGLQYISATVDKLDERVQELLKKRAYGQDVFMFGAVGTGKTYAIAALIRQYLYEGQTCERINFDDFCVQVRSTMAPAATITEWAMIEPLKQVDSLFIDDLGLRSEMETSFVYHTLYSLINKRQECLLPTFINSNKTIDQLAATFDERVASRLRTALVIELTGKDRRQAV